MPTLSGSLFLRLGMEWIDWLKATVPTRTRYPGSNISVGFSGLECGRRIETGSNMARLNMTHLGLMLAGWLYAQISMGRKSQGDDGLKSMLGVF